MTRCTLLLAALVVPMACAQDGPPPAAETPAGEAVPLPLRPYRIRVWLEYPRESQLSQSLKVRIVEGVRNLSQRYCGGGWELGFEPVPAQWAGGTLPSKDWLAENRDGFDKILWVTVGSAARIGERPSARLPVAVREYDHEFADWGMPGTAEQWSGPEVPEAVFDLMRRQFRPLADVVDVKVDPQTDAIVDVVLSVRGLALQPADSAKPFVPAGTPFKLYKDVTKTVPAKFLDKVVATGEVLQVEEGVRRSRRRDEADEELKKVYDVTKRFQTPYTYLVLKGVSRYGFVADSELVSAQRSPISKRERRRSRVHCIAAVQRQGGTTRLEFVDASRPDRPPVTGYVVALRPQGMDSPLTVGATDYRGSITLDNAPLASEVVADPNAARVLEVYLLAGRAVLARFPLVVGDEDVIRLPVRVDELVTEVSGLVQSIWHDAADVVAHRRILEQRLAFWEEQQEQTEDQEKIDYIRGEVVKVAQQINAMPDKKEFDARVEEVKQYIDRRREEQDRKRQGRAIRVLLAQTENLLGLYFKGTELQVVAEDAGEE